jgi:DNA helicase MCM8
VQEVQALLEVMEQQSVSIAKNGIICQFKCNTAIFASANPINGSYNRSKTFKENTKIPNALLSRFDLIFISVDHCDAERDKRLSRHILSVHTGNRKKNKAEKIFEEKQM